MIRPIVLSLGVAALLAACGADGEPIQPTANVGIGVSSSGVSAGAGVGVTAGPVSLNVSLF